MPERVLLPGLKAETGLDRCGNKRGDARYIAARVAEPAAKVLALVDLKVPIIASADRVMAKIRWLTLTETEAIATPDALVFLGEEASGAPVFACNFQPEDGGTLSPALAALQPLVDLRSLAIQGILGEAELLVASQARAILSWHAAHRCCTRCGARVHATEAGWRRSCPACGLDAFPRTDPAVIMLITHRERCLLGREHRFPEKMYSTLAGFVEAGDDIENAVRREIKEEAGLEVGEVRYVASQPWPFPYSLMIGCRGEALSDAIAIEATEIADARWFSRDEAAAMLATAHPEGLFVPPPISMAHTLIRSFVDGAFP